MLKRFLIWLVVVLLVLVGAVKFFLGTGEYLEDRTADPRFPQGTLEIVAELPRPPGNIAVSPEGRVFFTFHPQAGPDVNVAELKDDGSWVPWPNKAFQKSESDTPHFQTVLSLRIDRQGRLWTLDHAQHGWGQPRILAFDIDTKELVHRYEFPDRVSGFPSMLNDFQVGPNGRWIYIAEASPIVNTPALVVYDTQKEESRRLLDSHESVLPEEYIMQAPDRDMVILGLVALRIGVDSIALSRDGDWLYYGPVEGGRMYRIGTKFLQDPTLSEDELAARVEDYGPKTISDGITTDLAGNVYITDPEHSAILILTPERTLRTLIKDPRLRWPDGLSFGPDNQLYVTASSLHHVILRSNEHMKKHAPYHIFRFRPGYESIPGH